MKKTVKILGYYKRKRDGNEYVLFEENKRLYLTNGVIVWDNQAKRIEKRYMKDLERVDTIDLLKIKEQLQSMHQYSAIAEAVKEEVNARNEHLVEE